MAGRISSGVVIPITNRRELPPHTLREVGVVEAYGFHGSYQSHYPLTTANPTRVQLRESRHNAPPKRVNEYAEAMKNGAIFPPIIVSRDGVVLDGNTRWGAAWKNKMGNLEAIVLDFDMASITTDVEQRVIFLVTALNLWHGERITTEEMRRAVEYTIENNTDYPAKRVARLLNLRVSQVNAIMAAKKARMRIKELTGTEPSVKGENRTTLAQLITLQRAGGKLNDAPFLALVGLTKDADLKSGDITNLVKRMLANKADGPQVDMVNQERRARQRDIDDKATRGKVRQSIPTVARSHLAFLASKTPDQLIEPHSDKFVRSQYIHLLNRTIRTLTQVVKTMADEDRTTTA